MKGCKIFTGVGHLCHDDDTITHHTTVCLGWKQFPQLNFSRFVFSAIISCDLKHVCVVQGKNSALIQCKQTNTSESFPSRILMSHL